MCRLKIPFKLCSGTLEGPFGLEKQKASEMFLIKQFIIEVKSVRFISVACRSLLSCLMNSNSAPRFLIVNHNVQLTDRRNLVYVQQLDHTLGCDQDTRQVSSKNVHQQMLWFYIVDTFGEPLELAWENCFSGAYTKTANEFFFIINPLLTCSTY